MQFCNFIRVSPPALALTFTLAAASPITWTEYQGPSPGARAAGLSGCLATAIDEPTMIFWNPAGLGVMASPIFNLSYQHSSGLLHNPVFSGPKRVDYVSFASHGAGLAWRSLVRYRETSTSGQGGDTSFLYRRYGADEFSLALARHNEENGWSLGMAGKLIWARAAEVDQLKTGGSWNLCNIRDDHGYGYGLDLGIQGSYQVWRVGLSLRNLLGRVHWTEFEDDRLKPQISGGLSWHRQQKLVLSAGGEKFLGEGAPRLRYSAAGEYRHIVANMGAAIFRGGYSQTYQGPKDGYSWSLGLGYFYRRFRIDAAGVNKLDPASQQWRWSYVGSINLFTEQN
jgi:hypothetical protein